MNAVLVVVVVFLVGLALVLGGTGVAALIGKLPGNGVLGVRTPETRRSPEAWELANRAAAPSFLGSGLVLLLGALALGLIGGWIGGLVVVVSIVFALALLSVAGLAGARAAAMWDATQDDQSGCGCGPDGCGGHSGDSDSGGAVCAPAADTQPGDPAADCGVTGGCGSCALQGMCETENTSR
ncbi:SdpI family protein [Dietzia sp. ANT_WB102]|uniref:SdpI family protein n=1 Tax=Dietzia sp. ANT_WB102 TaxID=2597345 RepID=UPI0011EE57C1|nr:SdpI family protein [Dietzia sp. ANT_WB102]KAA0918300.1 SdpI family protein [Dietzia sp. ANT_WB102]